MTYALDQPVLVPCTIHLVILGCSPSDVAVSLTIGMTETFDFTDEVAKQTGC